jgi:hypothetical protein
MENAQTICERFQMLMPILIVFGIWEAVWKLIALWKAGRNNHLAWFICIALLNTAGILPIIYILLHRKKSAAG